jgi:hypothetical protein
MIGAHDDEIVAHSVTARARTPVWLGLILSGCLMLSGCATRTVQPQVAPPQPGGSSDRWICEPDSGSSGWRCRRVEPASG